MVLEGDHTRQSPIRPIRPIVGSTVGLLSSRQTSGRQQHCLLATGSQCLSMSFGRYVNTEIPQKQLSVPQDSDVH